MGRSEPCCRTQLAARAPEHRPTTFARAWTTRHSTGEGDDTSGWDWLDQLCFDRSVSVSHTPLVRLLYVLALGRSARTSTAKSRKTLSKNGAEP